MQTPDKTGIVCDFCNITFRYDFNYYSINLHKIRAYNNMKPSLDTIRGSAVSKSLDICPNCYEAIADEVVRTYSRNMNNKTGIVKVFCEITGKSLQGVEEYFYAIFMKVSVLFNNQPMVCIKCNKTIKDETAKCVCGSNAFRRQSAVNVSDRELEFYMSSDVYTSWLEKLKTTSRDNSWSSAS